MSEAKNNCDLKFVYTQSIEKLENYVNNFEKLINHQELYLDNYVFEIKNKIDIQREELIAQIQKISAEMISNMDLFYDECVKNLPNLEELTEKIRAKLVFLKSDLNEMKNEFNNTQLDQEKIDEIEENLKENEKYIFEYENELRQNKNCIFKPINYELPTEFFGQLCFKRTNYKDFNLKIIKSFNDPVSRELDRVMDVYEDYKLAIGNSFTRGVEISIFNIQTAECINTIIDCHNDMISSLKWLSKHKLASGSCDNTLKIWNVINSECLRVLIGHDESVSALTYFKNYLFSSSCDGKIKIWDMNSVNFDCVNTFKEENEEPKALLATTNGNLIVLYDERIKVLNATDNYKCILVIEQENIFSIELMENDNIACCTNFKLKILDIQSGHCIKYVSLFDIEDRDFVHYYFSRLLTKTTFVVIYDFGFKIYDMDRDEFVIETDRIEGLDIVENVRVLSNDKLLILNSCQIENTEENIYETSNQIKIIQIS